MEKLSLSSVVKSTFSAYFSRLGLYSVCLRGAILLALGGIGLILQPLESYKVLFGLVNLSLYVAMGPLFVVIVCQLLNYRVLSFQQISQSVRRTCWSFFVACILSCLLLVMMRLFSTILVTLLFGWLQHWYTCFPKELLPSVLFVTDCLVFLGFFMRYGLTYLFVIEANDKPFDAFSRSASLVTGNFWKLALFYSIYCLMIMPVLFPEYRAHIASISPVIMDSILVLYDVLITPLAVIALFYLYKQLSNKHE